MCHNVAHPLRAGLSGYETPEEFADMAYGLKFDFTPMTGPFWRGTADGRK
jgi:hypothetical protein